MNMAIAIKAGSEERTYLIGVNAQALVDYCNDVKNGISCMDYVRIKDAESQGLGKEKIEEAKEKIRAGEVRVLDLGFESNTLVFQGFSGPEN